MEHRGKSAEKWKLSDRWEISLPTSEMLRELIQHWSRTSWVLEKSWMTALGLPCQHPIPGVFSSLPISSGAGRVPGQGAGHQSPGVMLALPSRSNNPTFRGLWCHRVASLRSTPKFPGGFGKEKFSPKLGCRNASAVISKAPQKMSLRNDESCWHQVWWKIMSIFSRLSSIMGLQPRRIAGCSAWVNWDIKSVQPDLSYQTDSTTKLKCVLCSFPFLFLLLYFFFF